MTHPNARVSVICSTLVSFRCKYERYCVTLRDLNLKSPKEQRLPKTQDCRVSLGLKKPSSDVSGPWIQESHYATPPSGCHQPLPSNPIGPYRDTIPCHIGFISFLLSCLFAAASKSISLPTATTVPGMAWPGLPGPIPVATSKNKSALRLISACC